MDPTAAAPGMPGSNQPGAWHDNLQQVLNARPVPDRWTRHREGIRVRARIVWSRDGEGYLDTVAFGWTRQLVLVRLDDARSQFRGVWIPVGDVQRSGAEIHRSPPRHASQAHARPFCRGTGEVGH